MNAPTAPESPPPSAAVEERLRLYPRALLFALALAWVLSLVGDGSANATGGRIGGDFPAFYAAGQLVLQGRGAELYDLELQAAAQRGLFGPEGDEGFLRYVYPPAVALPYAALAALPYRAAYVVHTLLMGGALLLAVRALPLPRLRRYPEALALAAIGFYPMLRAVTGAQNSALSAALFVAVGATAGPLAGVAAGGLLFKPQLAVPLLGLLLIGREARALLVAALVAALFYAANVLVTGPDWVTVWWTQAVAPFQDSDQAINAPNCVGWLGVIEAIAGVGHPVARGLGGALTFGTIGGLMALWARPERVDRPLRLAITAVGALLISPHAMFYDAAIALPALLLTADRRPERLPAVIAVWAFAWLDPLKALLGVSPTFVTLAAALIVATPPFWRAPNGPSHA